MRGFLVFLQPRPIAGFVAISAMLAALAWLSAGGPPDLLRVAGMIGAFLCLNIYATLHNDAEDFDLDRESQPSKPLVRGVASVREARNAAVAGGAAGVVSSALLSPIAAVPAAALLLLAYWHDTGAKRGLFSGIPSLLSAGVLPVWAWSAYGRLDDAERWIAGSLLSVLLFAPVYLFTTLWDFDATSGAEDVAHRLGYRSTIAVGAALHLVGGAVALALPASISWLEVTAYAVLAGAAAAMLWRRWRPQAASALSGLASAAILITALATWRVSWPS